MDTTSHPSESMMAPPETRHCRRGHHPGGVWRIAAIVAGFLIFWPLGVVLLVWTLWRDQIKAWPIWEKFSGVSMPSAPSAKHFMTRRPSNSALAQYLEQEQERLKAEQEKLTELVKAFEAFKDAERRSADQRDFEAFLQQRGTDENRQG